MKKLFQPRGIALIGASPDPAKLPGRPVAYLQRYGYEGGIYPVNPKHREIGGLPCFAAVAEITGPVNVALILLPGHAVPAALDQCGACGISYAIIIASGFAEAGNHDLQSELVAIAKRCGIRVIGPNCVGLIRPKDAVTATFSTVVGRTMPQSGGLALVTQSGALGNGFLQSFVDFGIGLSCWISTGNEIDLGALDFVDYLLDDENSQAIAMFVEGFKDGSRLVEIGEKARNRGKPLIVLRGGTSDEGRVASASHTGKLAGSEAVWASVSRQAGLIEVHSPQDLVETCLALQIIGARNDTGIDGLGVLTISGGLGVLVADTCAGAGLKLPTFRQEAQTRLHEILPAQAAVANPVDTALFADETAFAQCATIVSEDPGVSVVMLILTSLAHDYESLVSWLEEFGPQTAARGKRILVSYLSTSDPLAPEAVRRLLAAGVLVLPEPQRAVRVLGRLNRLNAWFARTRATRTLAISHAGSGGISAGDFLGRAGLPLVRERLCPTKAKAEAAAMEIGFPVALKVAAKDIQHKTDVGGVRLGLRTVSDVARAWDEIAHAVETRAPGNRIVGMMVQEMVEGGVELIVGCRRDPEFGPVIMLGGGGIWAELLDDVTFRALPVDEDDVLAMLRELKIHSRRGDDDRRARCSVRAIGRHRRGRRQPAHPPAAWGRRTGCGHPGGRRNGRPTRTNRSKPMTKQLIAPSMPADALEEASRMLGQEFRIEQWNDEATRDTIRHYSWGLGDDNPLFCDSEYAQNSKWGCIVAPPTFYYSVFDAVVAPGLPDIQWIYSGADWTYYKPLRVGTPVKAHARLVDVKEANAKRSGRMLVQTGEVTYTDPNGDLLAKVLSHCFRIARADAEGGLQYERWEPQTYTEEELKEIRDALLNEARRGDDTLYWEDVEIGEQMPGTVRGPLNRMDMTCYYAGAVGTSGYKSTKIKWKYAHLARNHPEQLPNNYDPSYYAAAVSPSIGHQDDTIATTEIGMPGAYDNGPQRMGFLISCATNWMGDDGFVREYSARIKLPNIFGDTQWFKGKVTGKREDGGLALIDADLWAKNQRGATTAVGTVVIELPRRGG